MLVNGVCFIITNRCTAACDICCQNCSPTLKEVMEVNLLVETIRKLKSLKKVKVIGFSGGEAFLYPMLLAEGIREAKAQGFSTTVATNGFWGAWPDKKIIETLNHLQPDHLSFSTDDAHRQYVSDEHLGRAVSFAKGFKIPFNLCIGENKKDRSAGEFLKSMGDYKYLSNFSVYAHVPAGRAQDFDAEAFYRHAPLAHSFCHSEGLIAIRYDGRVYPCCSPYVFDTAISLGNIKENSLEEIFDKGSDCEMMTIMQEAGFKDLIAYAQEKYGLHFNDPCTSSCEACHQLFLNPTHYEEFKEVLKKQYNHQMTDCFLGRKNA